MPQNWIPKIRFAIFRHPFVSLKYFFLPDFRYLFRSAYLTSDPFDLPFVHRLKVREFSFTPDTDPNDMNAKTSVWNCDGEILDCPKINVKVHCQMLPVFARGPTVAD
jgi:hypothetical protein